VRTAVRALPTGLPGRAQLVQRHRCGLRQPHRRLRHDLTSNRYLATAFVNAASRASASTAPSDTVTAPVRSMIAIAGCCGTLKRANTSPGSSLICGNVSEYLSTKSWNEASSPNQATPTNCTLPAHRLLAASTEGA